MAGAGKEFPASRPALLFLLFFHQEEKEQPRVATAWLNAGREGEGGGGGGGGGGGDLVALQEGSKPAAAAALQNV